MKKLTTAILAIALLLGFSGAFALSKRHRSLQYVIFAQKSGSTFTYSSSEPAFPYTCTSNDFTVCVFESSQDYTYFNLFYHNTFPSESPGGAGAPAVTYYPPGNSIYKSIFQ